jgi:hypothetical protein
MKGKRLKFIHFRPIEKNVSHGGIMGNIIDIKSRLKGQKNIGISKGSEKATITDISEVRGERIRSDRREVRRTILTEFISVHAIVPGHGLLKVFLYDINDKGLSFDLEEQRGSYNAGNAIELRVYLNHHTYFQIDVKVAHITHNKDEGTIRHGCHFVNDSINSEAVGHFVKFIESVAAHLRKDGGDILVTKINS